MPPVRATTRRETAWRYEMQVKTNVKAGSTEDEVNTMVETVDN
jgi:hypothetical protein